MFSKMVASANDLATNRPANDLATNRPANDLATNRPANDLATNRPANDLATNRPANDLATNSGRPSSLDRALANSFLLSSWFRLVVMPRIRNSYVSSSASKCLTLNCSSILTKTHRDSTGQ
jgi:uncharacterized protein (DUF2237 family)